MHLLAQRRILSISPVNQFWQTLCFLWWNVQATSCILVWLYWQREWVESMLQGTNVKFIWKKETTRNFLEKLLLWISFVSNFHRKLYRALLQMFKVDSLFSNIWKVCKIPSSVIQQQFDLISGRAFDKRHVSTSTAESAELSLSLKASLVQLKCDSLLKDTFESMSLDTSCADVQAHHYGEENWLVLCCHVIRCIVQFVSTYLNESGFSAWLLSKQNLQHHRSHKKAGGVVGK